MSGTAIRVLYVGFILLGDPSATGHTLSNLFGHCEHVEVMQYCLDYAADFHQTAYETIYLSSEKSRLYTNLKKAYRRHTGQINATSAGVSAVHAGQKSVVGELGKAILDVLPKRANQESLQRVDAFSPMLIYTLADNIATLKAAYWFSKRYDIPVVIHVMDDVESTLYGSFRFLAPFRKVYIAMLKRVYGRTVWNLAIGPKMAQEYERRHSIRFSYAMNTISALSVQPSPRNQCKRLVFSGGLHGGRAESLYQIGRLIQEDKELSIKAHLYVYTSKGNIERYGRELSSVASVLEYVAPERMLDNLGKADVLVHVESFEQSEIDYFRYSMSTKIPEYLSVGRPIFCYGPEEIATVAYLAEKKAGMVVSQMQDVRDSLLRLVSDQNLRETLGQRAIQVAQEEHLGSIVGARMENVFREAADMWKNR